ncbi:MAG TPA: NYN domain-containing protein [Candidatus Acidoferrum sp.]|nr:NYN domain-containing protein [Candidatus Acidoferrum sp.]
MDRYALLLDGGFVKKVLRSSLKHFPTVADVVDFCNGLTATPDLQGHQLYRIFYYDAPPYEGRATNPISGATINYATTQIARENRSLIDSLELQPNFAVRRGTLNHSGWSVSFAAVQRISAAIRAVPPNAANQQITANDLLPQINQKGVDMRIGLDIASLALKKLVHSIILVTGDSDFVPAMKLARKEGLRVYLAPMGQVSIMRELKAHADIIL